jgi:hypothetical protein
VVKLAVGRFGSGPDGPAVRLVDDVLVRFANEFRLHLPGTFQIIQVLEEGIHEVCSV